MGGLRGELRFYTSVPGRSAPLLGGCSILGRATRAGRGLLSRHTIIQHWILVLPLFPSYSPTHGKTFLTLGLSVLNYEAKKLE